MATQRERILVVENDPNICDLIARQTLEPLGYPVKVVSSATAAIPECARATPDLLITGLVLPGLSGKDLIVALSSQGLEIPIVVVSKKGAENDIIQAFRLGASDYLNWPAREAEIVSVVERVLKQVRARREREDLSRQLNQTNQELQRRVRELTTIFALGKAVTSITDQQTLFEKAVEGAVYVAEADCGWLLLREERGKAFLLSAQRNLPPEAAGQMHRAWDDGLSSLVGLSGEPLLISGEPLKKFRVSRFGKAALVVPVKARKEVIGLLVVVRKALQPFTPAHQRLLEAVADFASISLVNARLFKALEERAYASSQAAEKAQASAHSKDQLLQNTLRELRDPLSDALETIVSLLVGDGDRLNATQKALLRSAQDRLAKAAQSLQTISPSKP